MELTYENLKVAIKQMIAQPGLMIDLCADGDENNSSSWHLRIRYMNTVGGMQLCLKEVHLQGEGSGLYRPIDHMDVFCEETMGLYYQKKISTTNFYNRIRNLPEGIKKNIQKKNERKWVICLKTNK